MAGRGGEQGAAVAMGIFGGSIGTAVGLYTRPIVVKVVTGCIWLP